MCGHLSANAGSLSSLNEDDDGEGDVDDPAARSPSPAPAAAPENMWNKDGASPMLFTICVYK